MVIKGYAIQFQTSCCLLVVVGILLVVQPPFVFGGGDDSNPSANSTANDSTLNKGTAEEQKLLPLASKFNFDYLLGVLLAITFALAGGLGNVIPCYCKKVSSKQQEGSIDFVPSLHHQGDQYGSITAINKW